jgi:hypothetical protein
LPGQTKCKSWKGGTNMNKKTIATIAGIAVVVVVAIAIIVF